MEALHPISGIPGFIAMAAKTLAIFVVFLTVVAYTTLAERRIAAWIQDRIGPNRVGPFGLFQPLADGLKNVLKEETLPATAAKFYFLLGPVLTIVPALLVYAVIPVAAPLPTPWGVVDMIIADVPIGILFILGVASLGVYGLVLGGWASNNKYAFLGGLRASAQMVSYEVALGLSLVTVLMLAGNVTLTQVVWKQQEMGLWYVLPLSLSFIFFVISAFAETNRLPFDMPEAESELVAGYHTEYSAMKFSMFMIAEFGAVVTQSALMATLFFGGWDLPGKWDNMFWFQGQLISGFAGDGSVILANPAWWKTLLTFAAFGLKTSFFILVFIWIRWTLPRFRYDQVMALGWKVLLPFALGYVMVISGSILVLDELGVHYGLMYGLALTAVSLFCTVAFVFFIDRGRTVTGAGAQPAQKHEIKSVTRPATAPAGD